MSKRSRRQARNPIPTTPRRQLPAPASPTGRANGPTGLPAAPERLLLETVSSAKALAMLNVGDRVRFNHRTRPQYLRGVEGVVIELDHHTATVCVHQPVGRFGSGQVHRCPPLLLDRLHPAA